MKSILTRLLKFLSNIASRTLLDVPALNLELSISNDMERILIP
jgi:hypothetical protein